MQHNEPGLKATVARIMRLNTLTMPPETDDIGFLLTVAEARHKHHSRSDVWRAIGVEPKKGREYLSKKASQVDWPLFKTLRDYALDGDI